MEKLDWDTLPVEIIEFISQQRVNQKKEKSLRWIMVNKHWFNVSLTTIYHTISFGHENDVSRRRLELFCDTLKNSQYKLVNISGKLSCCFIDKHLDLLDIIINYCPNIQELNVPLGFKTSGYMASQRIISAYRNNKNRKEKEEGNVVPLWKNLEVIGGKHYRPHNNISITVFTCFATL